MLVTLVDLPDLTPEVVASLACPARRQRHSPHPTRTSTPSTSRTADHRCCGAAAYDRARAHPALIGRDHWERVVATAVGDHGARHYFRTTPHELVECGDLATGRDVDTPSDLDTSR